MRNFILAGHGKMASGMYSAIKLIIGEKNNVFTFDAYNEENFDIEKSFLKLFKNLDKNLKIVVITDIKSGSVNNFFVENIKKYNYALVNTMSLAVVINLINNDEDYKNDSEFLKNSIDEANLFDNKKFILDVLENEILDDDF